MAYEKGCTKGNPRSRYSVYTIKITVLFQSINQSINRSINQSILSNGGCTKGNPRSRYSVYTVKITVLFQYITTCWVISASSGMLSFMRIAFEQLGYLPR